MAALVPGVSSTDRPTVAALIEALDPEVREAIDQRPRYRPPENAGERGAPA
jgi:hypothetical protein